MRSDIDFMEHAIELARQGAEKNAAPIGCVIVLDGEIIGEGYNEVDLLNDPTAHAEILSIRRAASSLAKPQFRGAVLYSTLQPCGMCSMASIWAGVSRIVYGAERDQVHEMYFEDRHFETMDFIKDAFKEDLSVEGGVLGDACAGLYYGPNDNPPEKEQTNK